MKKIVIVTGLFNYPPISGGDLVMLSLFKELSRNFQLTVIYPPIKNRRENLLTLIPDVSFVDFNEIENWYEINASFIEKTFIKTKLFLLKRKTYLPSEKYFYYSFGPIACWIKHHIEQPDIIQVDFPWMLRIISFLGSDTTKIYVNHEIQFISNERKNALSKEPVNFKEINKIKAAEIEAMNKYDACLTLSEYDKSILQKEGVKTRLHTSALGIDLNEIKFLNHQKYNRLVFIGNGNHYPNLDAIEYFVADILPIIKLKLKDLKIYITGKYASSFTDNYKQHSELIWTGYVDDLNEILINSISIVPIRIGSGIRIKILESMASGCPVVTTAIGIEGIEAVDSKEVFISNDKNIFANRIVELFRNEAVSKLMAGAARLFVEKNYSIEGVAQKRTHIFNELLMEKK